jgi:transcriptional antiterminator RfaH
MNLDAASQWYVAHTRPHAEAKAAAHLSRQGFGVYLPRYSKRRRHARRVESVAAPLFPRYLFVSIDTGAQRWRAVQSTIGVTHLVCNGDAPVAVHDSIIDALKRREDTLGLIRLDQRPQFRVGDKVRIFDGPFTDTFGLFEGGADSERVTVLLDLLCRKVRVRMDLESVVAA